MAKGARASSLKANNVKLKKNVFGPVETARTARLSDKLLELARQPKPARDVEVTMDTEEDEGRGRTGATAESTTKDAMEVDTKKTPVRISKSRIEKKKVKSRKAGIVFPRFKDGPKNPKGKRVYRNQ